jgi:hypothetical protein
VNGRRAHGRRDGAPLPATGENGGGFGKEAFERGACTHEQRDTQQRYPEVVREEPEAVRGQGREQRPVADPW